MVGIFQLLYIFAPVLDDLTGRERHDLQTFTRLRTCSVQMADYFKVVARVDPQADVSLFIMIDDQRRKVCVHYPLKCQPPAVGSLASKYESRVLWARQHFTWVVDPQEGSQSSSSASHLRPIPKSQPRQGLVSNEVLMVSVYGAGKKTEYAVRANYFIDDLMKLIEGSTRVPASRQILYHHLDAGLKQIHSGETLWEHNVKNNSFFTMIAREKQWEDSSSEEEQRTQRYGGSSSDQLQKLLDETTYKELRNKFTDAKHKQREAQQEVFKALADVKRFERSHPAIRRSLFN
jgi:hypothetical protein